MDSQTVEPFRTVFPFDHRNRPTERTHVCSSIHSIYGDDLFVGGLFKGTLRFDLNFVMSADGLIDFADPDFEGGGMVSGFNPHDTWLMGALRAASDLVIVGAQTLRSEPNHLWTPDFICSAYSNVWEEQRRYMGASQRQPFNAFVTGSGNINWDAAVFGENKISKIIVTTKHGAERVKDECPNRSGLFLLVCNEADDGGVNLREMGDRLQSEFRVTHALCEGGPGFAGSLIDQGLARDLFVTIAPRIIGNRKDRPRPTMVYPPRGGYLPETVKHLVKVSHKMSTDPRNADLIYDFVRYRVL